MIELEWCFWGCDRRPSLGCDVLSVDNGFLEATAVRSLAATAAGFVGLLTEAGTANLIFNGGLLADAGTAAGSTLDGGLKGRLMLLVPSGPYVVRLVGGLVGGIGDVDDSVLACDHQPSLHWPMHAGGC